MTEHPDRVSPYTPPAVPLRDPKAPTDAELRAFVGDAADDYLKKWIGLRSGGSRFAGFNFVALFFGPAWYLYRKMYWETGVVFLTEFFLSYSLIGIMLAFGFQVEPSPESLGVLILLAWGLGVLVALIANPLYYRRARLEIARRVAVPEDKRLEQIAKRGGTSIGSAVVGMVLLGALSGGC